MNDTVYSFLNHENLLIAAGSFSAAGGTSADCIASWNGSSWAPYTSGMRGTVLALIMYNGQLIAAGMITADGAGGNEINYIAAWND